ncbi:MAG: undecaprenyldiphospho-muramoylpentapeptide beta-N-acetylglucosaminyltransferase [Candidatus Aminicenantes bacterium]
MKTRTVLFSGGGTAGHLYPALTLAAALKKRDPRLQTLFVGTGRPVEREILEKSGEPYITLRLKGLKGKGLSALKSLFLLPGALWKSLRILRQVQPDLAVGMGGYSSGPVLLAASWKRIPAMIMEQNLHPGLTNRLLLPRVHKAVAAFEESLPEFKGKGVFLGNPVRDAFYELPPKTRNEHLSLFIFGGSQGSHFINKKMVESLPLLKIFKNQLHISHQTGPDDLSWVEDGYRGAGFGDAQIFSFSHDMPGQFQKTDLVMCRAGATTIAELIAARKAAVLIPFSKASESHQEQNARVLEKAGGALILREEDFTVESFTETIADFIHHPDKLNQMERNLESMRIQNPAERIADLCFRLMSGKEKEK